MRSRPLLLIFCALLFLYFPIEGFLHIARGEMPNALDILFCFVLPIIVLVGLVRVQSFGWYTLVAFLALWGFKDLYEYNASRGANTSTILTHLAIFIMSMGYFLNPRIRRVFFDPKLRWWRTKSRYETYNPAILYQSGKFTYPVLKNISMGGCFALGESEYKVGDPIEVLVPLPVPLGRSTIQVTGEIRWVSQSKTLPGVGIQFSKLDRANFKAVQKYVQMQI